MAVAVAVQSGSADVGLGVRAAAAALGLDFVPLEWERYDLAIPSANVPTDLIDLIRSDVFRRAAEALSGYDASHSGRVVIET